MPTETYPAPRLRDAGAPAGAAPSRRGSRRRPGNPLPALVLGLFVVFFLLPVLWLVLAATKTDDQLVHGNPLSFGSWHALSANWHALTGYQDDAIFVWL